MSEAAAAAPASTILNPGAPSGTPPAPAAATIPIDQMTPEQATARLAAIKADPDWKAAFAKGDIKAAGEHAALFRVIYSTAPAQTQEQAQGREQREQLVGYYRTIAHIDDDVAKMVIEDTPVEADERLRAEQEWERLKSDPDWRRKWLSGDREARTQKTLIDIIMARPVK